MGSLRWTAVVALSCALIAAPAAGQVSIGVGGLYSSLGGNDYESVDAGIGADVGVWFRLGRSFDLGGGLQYTRQKDNDLDETVAVLGFFAEPRYRFAMKNSKITPYLAGRAAWNHGTADVSGLGDFSTSGLAFAGGGGVMIGLGSSASLDLEALFGSISFGDVEIDGTKISDTSTSGSGVTFRAGINFGLGR